MVVSNSLFRCRQFSRRQILMLIRFVVTGILLNFSLKSVSAEQPLSRIAFGSCAKQTKPQPIWKSIVKQKPDIFLFIGDNIYGDTRDMRKLKTTWDKLGTDAGYQSLKNTCPILATWDDHDYGENDAGAEYPKKRESQQLFLDFFDEPADSVRRQTDGIYAASIHGPPGKRVQIILLDTRFFRSPLKLRSDKTELGEGRRGPYMADDDPQKTLLGETQWQWLENQLKQPAELRIIASSIQIISNKHGWEKWGNFPLERDRLFQLIKKTGTKGVVFISGDRHSAEVSCLKNQVDYPLYDVTSSSLNQPNKWNNELNPHRLGNKYFDENFGMILIDWSEDDPTLRMQIRNLHGEVIIQVRTRLSKLQRAKSEF